MPYIKSEDRELFKDTLPYVITDIRKFPQEQRAGMLNYCITELLDSYRDGEWNYQQLNDVVGMLESCKSEFERRLVAPYEDEKRNENGDVEIYARVEKKKQDEIEDMINTQKL